MNKLILSCLFGFTFTYILGAYGSLTFNPLEWHVDINFDAGILRCTSISIAVCFSVLIYNLWGEND